MNPNKLQAGEIKKRLIRLRNLERLYGEQNGTIQKLRAKNHQLKSRVIEQQQLIEKLLLRIEELERMVFGQKGGGSEIGNSRENRKNEPKATKERSALSFKRKIPQDIDQEEYFGVEECSKCHGKLEKKQLHEQYLEDILLPCAQEKAKTKQARKEIVEKGWCSKCQKWSFGKKIQPHRVMLGPNIKNLILFALYVLGLSFDQTRAMTRGMYDFEVSDGEITNILEGSKEKFLPTYQNILQRIRGQPGNHMDETLWQQGSEKNYAWVLTGTETEEAVFSVGQTRGKGVAQKLRGASKSVLVSDGYGAYMNLASKHQQCWAHFRRTARDLKNSETLSKKKRKLCEGVYGEIGSIYESLRIFCGKEFEAKEGKHLKGELSNRIDQLVNSNHQDPEKLRALKNHLKNNEERLFTCLEKPGIPPDNNKAERKLRHLVLKRKKSFGTKTSKGSHAFSINMSVLMSLWWTDPSSWFKKTHSILTA